MTSILQWIFKWRAACFHLVFSLFSARYRALRLLDFLILLCYNINKHNFSLSPSFYARVCVSVFVMRCVYVRVTCLCVCSVYAGGTDVQYAPSSRYHESSNCAGPGKLMYRFPVSGCVLSRCVLSVSNNI